MSDQIQNIRIKYIVDSDDLGKAQKGLGGITTESKEVADAFKKVNTEASKANNEIASGSTNSANLTKSLGGEIKNLAGNVNIMGVNAGQAFNSLNNGLGGAVKGLGLVRLGFLAIPLVAFASAIAGVVAYFTRTEKGSEQLQRALAGVGATISVIIGRFASLGAGLKALFSGDFSEAATIFKSAFTGIGDEISKASKSAVEFTGVLQDIEDAEDNLALTIAKQRNQIQLLMIQSRERGVSEKQRIELLKQADQLEQSIINQQIALQIRKVNALKEENDLKVKSGEIDKGNKTDALRQAEIELENLRGNSLELRAKLQNRISGLEIAAAKKVSKEKVAILDDELSSTIEIEKNATDEIFDYKTDAEHELNRTAIFAQAEADKRREEDIIKTKEAEERKQAIISASFQTINTLSSSFAEIANNENQKRLTALDAERANELKKVGDNKQAQAAINRRFDAEERKLKREQALIDRNLAIFNIVISTAQAIAKANPIVPLMVLAGVAGAAQLAAVASRPIPKFNKGTKSVPGADLGDDSVLAMVRPTEKIFPVDTSKQYSPALDAIFDHKIPASLINSFAVDYDRIGGLASQSSATNDNSKIIKELSEIKKALANIKTTEVNVDKKGIKTLIKSQQSETEFTNNYFKN